MLPFSRKLKLGLALGGGAARGLAHIGVLEVLERNNVPVDVITGTSFGAIVGSMYAAKRDIIALKKKINEYLQSDIFLKAKSDFHQERSTEEGEGIFYRFSQFIKKSIFYSLSITKKSFITEETFLNNIAYLIDDINIEETKIPFAAPAFDIQMGKEFVFDRGSLRLAVAASCALPGIMPPVEYNGMTMVDGGWIDAVPVNPARGLGADVVIGVDVGGGSRQYEDPKNSLEVVFRADILSRHAQAHERMKNADLILSPDVEQFNWADFSMIDEIIERGRVETERRLEDIKKLIIRKKIRHFLTGKS